MLFADRNILSDQTAINDFRLFIGDIAKLSSQAKTIERSDGSTEAVTLAVTKIILSTLLIKYTIASIRLSPAPKNLRNFQRAVT